MSISGRTSAAVKQFALWTMLCVISLAGIIAGAGFLVAAFFTWVSQHEGNAAAAGITGGGLLAITVLFGLIGGAVIKKLKKPQPGMLSEFSGLLVLGARLITMTIRRDPRKAIIVSAIAGALAEFITSERRK